MQLPVAFKQEADQTWLNAQKPNNAAQHPHLKKIKSTYTVWSVSNTWGQLVIKELDLIMNTGQFTESDQKSKMS